MNGLLTGQIYWVPKASRLFLDYINEIQKEAMHLDYSALYRNVIACLKGNLDGEQYFSTVPGKYIHIGHTAMVKMGMALSCTSI